VDETTARFWHELLARPSGPLALRFLLQPALSTFFGLRDGRRDAKYGRPAYFWALFTQGAHRRELLNSGWQAIGRLVLMALALDTVYQFIALRAFRPLEAIVIAIILCIVPYLLIRGPVNRLLRWLGSRESKRASRKAA
jgi:hypothetical protein